MEALVAILLLSSFSVVIGWYWRNLSLDQKNAESQLRALSAAGQMVDNLSWQRTNMAALKKEEKSTISLVESRSIQPQIIKGSLKYLDRAQLIRVTVSSNKRPIALEAICVEQHD